MPDAMRTDLRLIRYCNADDTDYAEMVLALMPDGSAVSFTLSVAERWGTERRYWGDDRILAECRVAAEREFGRMLGGDLNVVPPDFDRGIDYFA